MIINWFWKLRNYNIKEEKKVLKLVCLLFSLEILLLINFIKPNLLKNKKSREVNKK